MITNIEETVEKYANVSTRMMLAAAQDEGERLASIPKDAKKVTKTRLMKEREKSLMDMKAALRRRLDAMDRNSPEFFPVGSFVTYSSEEHEPAKGIVTDHANGKCRISFERHLYAELWIEPRFLTLLYLR